jgi:hypothetical protein
VSLPRLNELPASILCLTIHWPKGKSEGTTTDIEHTSISHFKRDFRGFFLKGDDSSSPTSLSWMGYFIDWVAALGLTETVLVDQLTAR